MKTYKTTSTVTVVLANGEAVVHENAMCHYNSNTHVTVFHTESGRGIKEYPMCDFDSITCTVARREVMKRTVYIVRYTNGVETEHESLDGAYNSVYNYDGSYEHLHSIRREEREKSV